MVAELPSHLTQLKNLRTTVNPVLSIVVISTETFLLFAYPQTTGRLVDLPRAVYTVDFERHSHHPIIAAGTSNFVYLAKRT